VAVDGPALIADGTDAIENGAAVIADGADT